MQCRRNSVTLENLQSALNPAARTLGFCHGTGLKTLTEFGTDIFLLHDCERVALWKHGSGYDAAGLDYLIQARKEYYVRRQQESTLKRGDRVAVLGHGIAVVKQVDGREVHVALGNRLVLRIARKEIVVNEQNNRWECSRLSIP